MPKKKSKKTTSTKTMKTVDRSKVMKAAGKYRKEGKTAKQALKLAWNDTKK